MKTNTINCKIVHIWFWKCNKCLVTFLAQTGKFSHFALCCLFSSVIVVFCGQQLNMQWKRVKNCLTFNTVLLLTGISLGLCFWSVGLYWAGRVLIYPVIFSRDLSLLFLGQIYTFVRAGSVASGSWLVMQTFYVQ